jgi:hypothetical protein
VTSEIDEKATEEAGSVPLAAPADQPKPILHAIRVRQVSEKDLGSTGVQRMLVDSIDRLESELKEAQSFREKFHDADKKLAVLTESKSISTALSAIITATIALSSAAIGAAPSYITADTLPQAHLAAWIVFCLSLILLLVAIIAQIIKWK